MNAFLLFADALVLQDRYVSTDAEWLNIYLGVQWRCIDTTSHLIR